MTEKTIEKCVLRAYWKMMALFGALYALGVGAWFGIPKLMDWWNSKERRERN